MDEKGFLLGVHNRAKVIVRHRRRPLIEKMDGSREWITVVECTCADSSMLPPLVIGQGGASGTKSVLRQGLYTDDGCLENDVSALVVKELKKLGLGTLKARVDVLEAENKNLKGK